MGRIVLTLVSLFPSLLEKGLYMASGEISNDLDENVNEKNTQVNIDNEDAIGHKSIRSGKFSKSCLSNIIRGKFQLTDFYPYFIIN